MQQTPKALFYTAILAAAPPENHLCFISFSCLSLRPPHGAWGDLAEMEGSQQSVPFRGEKDIEAILQ